MEKLVCSHCGHGLDTIVCEETRLLWWSEEEQRYVQEGEPEIHCYHGQECGGTLLPSMVALLVEAGAIP